MKEAGCRLLIVGYESGDPQILKNIKKGATIDMALRFTENCKKLALVIHETLSSVCRVRLGRQSNGRLILQSDWIRKQFRARSPTLFPVRNCMTTAPGIAS